MNNLYLYGEIFLETVSWDPWPQHREYVLLFKHASIIDELVGW